MRLSRDAAGMTNTSLVARIARKGGSSRITAGRASREEVSAIKRSAIGAARQADREALAARFAAGEGERRRRAQKLRGELRTRHAAERRALNDKLRTERWTAREELREQGMDARTADALCAFRAASLRESLAKRHRDERAAVTASLARPTVWRTWLEGQAAAGDQAAQAGLRGIRYREQRKRRKDERESDNGIEGEALDPLEALHERLRRGPDDLVLATLTADHDRRGTRITYRSADGKAVFIDRGPRIDMLCKDDQFLEAALRIAAEKYGGQVLLTGSDEFQRRAARIAARLGVRVTNPSLGGIVREERERIRPSVAPTRAPSPGAMWPATAATGKPSAVEQGAPPGGPDHATVRASLAAHRAPHPGEAIRWWNTHRNTRAAWSAVATRYGLNTAGGRGVAGAWRAAQTWRGQGWPQPTEVATAAGAPGLGRPGLVTDSTKGGDVGWRRAGQSR